MKEIESIDWTQFDTHQERVIAIGNFDGVHFGHQQIIKIGLREAQKRNSKFSVFTFRPHPQIALWPQKKLPLLISYDQKVGLLKHYGAQEVIEQPFSRDFSEIEPKDFFAKVLLEKLSAKCIVVGHDFAFGRERSGHLEQLKDLCEQRSVDLVVVPAQTLICNKIEHVVSSTLIRTFLSQGNLSCATEFLGRPYEICGIVQRGDGRGKLIGFPTANVKPPIDLLLPLGVYATWARVDQKIFPSVTNLGKRPTFEGGSTPGPLIETHLLDTDLDLYGKIIEVRWVAPIRGEVKFEGTDKILALKQQIGLDIQKARALLSQDSNGQLLHS